LWTCLHLCVNWSVQGSCTFFMAKFKHFLRTFNFPVPWKEQSGLNQSIALLFKGTKCCLYEKEQDNLIQPKLNIEPAAIINWMGHRKRKLNRVSVPHFICVCYRFSIWSMLHQFFLLTALDIEPHGLIHTVFLLVNCIMWYKYMQPQNINFTYFLTKLLHINRRIIN
jgi:hypothetical protein